MKNVQTQENPMILVPEEDFERLRALAVAQQRRSSNNQPSLLRELDRATVLPRALLPNGTVTINSRVRFRDAHTGEEEEYVLTWPDQTDGGVERISILAPIGSALLGFRKGDSVSWPTPGGTRRLQILEVEPVTVSATAPSDDPLARLLYGSR